MSGGQNVFDVHTLRRILVSIHDRGAGREVDAAGPVLVGEWLGDKDLARLAVHRVSECVAVEVHQELAHPAIDRQVDEDALVHGVVVVLVVRRQLIRPARLAVVGVTGEECARPLVVARPLVLGPGARIRRAVVNEIEIGIVGDPSPHTARAVAPSVGRPARDSQILPSVFGVKGFESRADLDEAVGARAVRSPELLPGLEIERGDPPVDTHLTAGIPDNHFVPDDQRRHRHCLAGVHVSHLGLPDDLASVGIQRDRAIVEQVVDQLAIGVRPSPIHNVAACHADRPRVRVGPILPFHDARLREIEGIRNVRIRCHQIHRAADDEGRAFMPM